MEQPFLPPPAPSDNPPLQKKKGSPVITWLALIGLFLMIWSWLSVKSTVEDERSWFVVTVGGLGWLVSWSWPFLLIGGVFGYFWWQFRGSAQFQLAQEPGLLSLAEGRLDEAAAIFRASAEKYRRQLQFSSVARYNLATTLMRKGELKAAIAELVRVESGAGLAFASEIRLLAAIQLARGFVLTHQLEPAQRWIDEARLRLTRSTNRTFAGADLRVVESMLQCRQGRFDEAVRGLERDWRQLEANLAMPLMRSAWLMRAYALSQLGGPRGEGAASPYVTLLRGQPLDHLATEWPELRTFLVANSLSTLA
jgi:tetratricopeptide (TPR) repeat protein